MKLKDEQKFQVLLAVLKERYNSANQMRGRSTQFTLWISGMAVGLAWLLVSKKGPILISQRLALSGLIVALAGGSIYFIVSLARGLNNNREVMINVEHSLSLYEDGIFIPESSLLPKEYSSQNRRWSHHGVTHSVWLILITLLLLTLTWIQPVVSKPVKQPENKQMKEQNHDYNATNRLQ